MGGPALVFHPSELERNLLLKFFVNGWVNCTVKIPDLNLVGLPVCPVHVDEEVLQLEGAGVRRVY